MSQRYVLIFAKTPYSKTPYDQWLAGTGIEPIILTSEELAPGYAHVSQVFAFHRFDQNRTVEKKALEIVRSCRVIAVFARAESDVIRAAQLRSIAGIAGQSLESALSFRDKLIMKKRVSALGVPLAKFQAVDSGYTLIRFVEETGYPIVLKPTSESGSTGTQVIRNESDLDASLADFGWGPQIAEAFIEGPMFHVDGLVLDGKIAFIHPFRYINDCLAFRENRYTGSCSLSRQDPLYDRLIEVTSRILSGLPTPRNTAFHAELWRDPQDRIVFCEIASRTGGGMISSSIQHGFGIKLDKEWLYAECGVPQTLGDLIYRPTGSVIIPPLNGILDQLPTTDVPDCVRETQIVGHVGQRFHGGTKSGLFLAGYVVDGTDEDTVFGNLADVAAWFGSHSRWRQPSEIGETL